MGRGADGWVGEASSLRVVRALVQADPEPHLAVASGLGADVRVFVVAGGGCTVAAYAASGFASHLHFVDPNPAHLALTRLKLRLLARVAPARRLPLLGYVRMATAKRAEALERELGGLALSLRVLGPLEAVASLGLDRAGRMEMGLEAFRKALAKRQPAIRSLLGMKDPAAQVKAAVRTTALGAAIAEAWSAVFTPAGLDAVFDGERAMACRPDAAIAKGLRRALAAGPARENPYLWQFLLGCFPEGRMTPWLEAASPTRMPAITWTAAGIAHALDGLDGRYDLADLGSGLDGLTPTAARRALVAVYRGLRPGGVVLLRAGETTPDLADVGRRFKWDDRRAKALRRRDRSVLAGDLHLGHRA